jgi:hypothetical protein
MNSASFAFLIFVSELFIDLNLFANNLDKTFHEFDAEMNAACKMFRKKFEVSDEKDNNLSLYRSFLELLSTIVSSCIPIFEFETLFRSSVLLTYIAIAITLHFYVYHLYRAKFMKASICKATRINYCEPFFS